MSITVPGLAYNGSDYTYNGHLGIDTEIKGFAAQAVGVPIFAALDGTVIETHDGEPDMNTQGGNIPVNYVKLDHGNSQTTTYLHMKRNSVAVTLGQGNSLATNDDWADTQQAEIQATNLQPPNAKESAIIIVRPPANTTAIVAAKNASTGNALVEAYILSP
jgi:Peptidase family M23